MQTIFFLAKLETKNYRNILKIL